MVKVICAHCGNERDYDDFPVLEKFNLVDGESICSFCTGEKLDNLVPIDETTLINENPGVDY